MKLVAASKKAIKYSCINYHYAKKVPAISLAFSVFNDTGDFCGVIAYGLGAAPQSASPYGLKRGEVMELLRVALNGKQESTSQAVSISIKLLKRFCPTIKMLVSYADEGQSHKGILYQATNWIYTGDSYSTNYILKGTNKIIHSKTAADRYQGADRRFLIPIKDSPKHKYIFPITKEARQIAEKLRKKYPKKCVSSVSVAHQAPSLKAAVQIRP